MDPMTWTMLAGAVLGAAKGDQDMQKANKQRKMEAEIARYSPWSGMAAQRVQEADPFGSILQGGLAGGMMGQQFGRAPVQQDPYGYMTPTVRS